MTTYDYGEWTHVTKSSILGGYAGNPFFKHTTRKLLGFVEVDAKPWIRVKYVVHGEVVRWKEERSNDTV